MPKPYSEEFRIRVIEDVVTGASGREAAEHYGISASVVVIWALVGSTSECGHDPASGALPQSGFLAPGKLEEYGPKAPPELPEQHLLGVP